MVSDFRAWCRLQVERLDPVGRVARDIAQDDSFPVVHEKSSAIVNHYRGRGVDSSDVPGLAQAWHEYRTHAAEALRLVVS
jgi:hypothetical protein